jgi:hypothetical protein
MEESNKMQENLRICVFFIAETKTNRLLAACCAEASCSLRINELLPPEPCCEVVAVASLSPAVQAEE